VAVFSGLSEILEPILKSRKRRADERNVEQKRPKKVLTEIENSFDSGEITQEKGVFDCFNTLSGILLMIKMTFCLVL
jgi:hypothetical protein